MSRAPLSRLSCRTLESERRPSCTCTEFFLIDLLYVGYKLRSERSYTTPSGRYSTSERHLHRRLGRITQHHDHKEKKAILAHALSCLARAQINPTATRKLVVRCCSHRANTSLSTSPRSRLWPQLLFHHLFHVILLVALCWYDTRRNESRPPRHIAPTRHHASPLTCDEFVRGVRWRGANVPRHDNDARSAFSTSRASPARSSGWPW